MSVSFFSTDVDFIQKNKLRLRNWINSEIAHHSFSSGKINIIFCSDAYLLELNRKHLNHDYYTDIITFDYTEGLKISGDLFISIDRVNENALSFSTNSDTEVRRVIIHGIFHLMGHQDNTEYLKKNMHLLEDAALTRYESFS